MQWPKPSTLRPDGEREIAHYRQAECPLWVKSRQTVSGQNATLSALVQYGTGIQREIKHSVARSKSFVTKTINFFLDV